VIKENDDKTETIVMDHIGKLLHLVVRLYLMAEECKLEYVDLTIFKKIIENLLQKIDCLTMEDLGIVSFLFL
jgi:hypothetical protein